MSKLTFKSIASKLSQVLELNQERVKACKADFELLNIDSDSLFIFQVTGPEFWVNCSVSKVDKRFSAELSEVVYFQNDLSTIVHDINQRTDFKTFFACLDWILTEALSHWENNKPKSYFVSEGKGGRNHTSFDVITADFDSSLEVLNEDKTEYDFEDGDVSFVPWFKGPFKTEVESFEHVYRQVSKLPTWQNVKVFLDWIPKQGSYAGQGNGWTIDFSDWEKSIGIKYFDVLKAVKELSDWMKRKQQAIKALGFKLETADDAPQTLEGLQDYLRHQNSLLVWNGASDKAIWSKDENLTYRWVHDFHHLVYGIGTGVQEEKKLWEYMQPVTLKELSKHAHLVLKIEHIGQVEWYELTGSFPENQQLFMVEALKAEGYTLVNIPYNWDVSGKL